MVKVTVEHNGNVTVQEGDFFCGTTVKIKETHSEAISSLVGSGSTGRVVEAIEGMTKNVIEALSENQVEACGNLILLRNCLDSEIQRLVEENPRTILSDIGFFLKEAGNEND